jgi:hypothetical protein
MKRYRTAVVAIAFVATAIVITGAHQNTTPALNTAAIDQALGLTGQAMAGDVYRVAIPRTDLKVVVDGVSIRTGLALGGWAAFKRMGGMAAIHGDVVLLDEEVNPFISKLQAANLEITAVHNHVLNEAPHVMYVHYWGMGAEAALAKGLHDALAVTKTPLTPAAPPATPIDPGFDTDAFQKAIGRTGAVRNGVLSISVPRPEKIMMMGVELPPSMGMATALNIQSSGDGKVAATGDFVLIDDEVNPVAKALRSNGIAVTALHNHMLHGTPSLMFMHFWAHDSAANVAAGLKAAIDLLAK